MKSKKAKLKAGIRSSTKTRTTAKRGKLKKGITMKRAGKSRSC